MSLIKRNNFVHILIFEIIFLAMAGGTVFYITNIQGVHSTVYLCLSAVLAMLVVASSLIIRSTLCENNYNTYLVLLATAFSIGLMLLTKSKPEIPVWTLGAIVTAAFVDSGIGLFLGYFTMLQMVNLAEMDLIVYFSHVICLLFVCQKIRKLKGVNTLIYTNIFVICINLLIYLSGKIYKLTSLTEKETIFIIATYLVLITCTGTILMIFKKPNFKKIQLLDTDEYDDENTTEAGSGFAYLNEMADDLSKMESIKAETSVETELTAQPATLEDILNAEINELKVSDIEPITDYEAPAGLSPVREPEFDFAEFIELHNDLLIAIKEKNKQSYIQSLRVAALAEECSKRINANHTFAKAIGLFYQVPDFYEDYPEKLQTAINEIMSLNSKSGHSPDNALYLSTKEAAVVYLTIKVSAMFFYLKASKSTSINPQKLVDGIIGNEMLNGTVNNSGLSVKECSEIRAYFVEKFNALA